MSYGLPKGSRITYGSKGFPPWVYELGNAFGLKASTYPGHQETNRAEAGFAANPQNLNRGIDWSGPVENMQRFADYCLSIRSALEQVIWENPGDRRRVGVAGGKDVTASGYYAYDGGYNAHRDHVHTRQSDSIPLPGNAIQKPPSGGAVSGWTGDPLWLADVLRADGQIDVREFDGWKQRGHGDFKDIRGIMFHHTGGPASAASIAHGRSDLAGPLSQLHISREGVVTVICAGVAWHAGVGRLSWIPANMGNWHLVGVECEWPYLGSGVTGPHNAHLCPWDPRQIKAMRNVAAAFCRKVQYGADRVTTHKSYAGALQGKWDPGYFDEAWFQREVAKDLSGFAFPGEGTPTQTPLPVPVPLPPPAAHRDVLLYRGVNDPAAVRKLQAILKAKIVSRLVVDGDYGPATEAAVRAFQQSKYRKPPLVVDGVVGPATAAQLGLVL